MELERPPINHTGQRRRPGHASRMHNRKATRMKPPTILVATVAPPRSIDAPTGSQTMPSGDAPVSPRVMKFEPAPIPIGVGRMGEGGYG